MRIIFDYGGTIVDHVDESRYSSILDSGENKITSPGYIAYKAYSLGIIKSHEEYINVLSKLTGTPKKRCKEYFKERRLATELPEERKKVLEDLHTDHSLVLFTDQVKPWIEEELERHGISDLFDELVVSSEVGFEKPHPKGYSLAIRGVDTEETVMVSDELNDDLVMAKSFGITTVWIENDYEEVYVSPDYRVNDMVEVRDVIEELN